MNERQASASSRTECRKLWMITGLKTFSSKFPCEPANPIAASLPNTCTATMVIASDCVGFTFPGMIDDPGSFSGSISSPSPARGPEASQRTSFAIFISDAASVFSAPLANTSSSCAESAANLFGCDLNGRPVSSGDLLRGALGKFRMRVQPGSHGGATDREIVKSRQDALRGARRRDRAGSPSRTSPGRR